MDPENPLEHALIAAATEPDARPTFYRLMLESPLYTIDDNPANRETEGVQTIATGARLYVPTIEIEGVQHTPIFSSPARVSAALADERKYVSMLGRTLLEVFSGAHLVLNPGSPYGKRFLPDEVAAMLSGDIFREYTTHTVDVAQRVLLGQPAHPPTHITDALAKLFRSLPDVKAAYLAHCAFPDKEEPPHTMIGIDAGGEWTAVIEPVMRAIGSVRHDGEVVDVVRIDDSEISSYMVRETKPFYRRKRFGIF